MMNSIDGTYSLESEVDFADIVQPRAPAQVSVLSRPVAAASTPNGQGSSTEPTKAEYKSEQLKKQSVVKYCKMHKVGCLFLLIIPVYPANRPALILFAESVLSSLRFWFHMHHDSDGQFIAALDDT